MFREYFPLGVAKGRPFFNRTQELKRVINNIKGGTHTLLIGPRRYGKTSLAKHAISKMKYLHAEIDLFVAVNDLDVGHKIIRSVEILIQKLTSGHESAFHALRQYFLKAEKKWTIGFKGLKLELTPNDPKSVPQNILDVLDMLEFMLSEYHQKAIVYIDEFQEILQTDSGKAIEGAIRHFAQESQKVVFLFSGSSRHLLKKQFNDRSRPLYALCDEIHMKRIDAHYYESYLQKVSQATLNQEISPEVVSTLLALSGRHPRYVYVLCREVWLQLDGQLMTVQFVENVWKEYVEQKLKDVRAELTKRSSPQMKLLSQIARGKTRHLSALESQKELEMTSSVIVQALKVLEEQDYIERLSDASYRLIDPLIKSVLCAVNT